MTPKFDNIAAVLIPKTQNYQVLYLKNEIISENTLTSVQDGTGCRY